MANRDNRKRSQKQIPATPPPCTRKLLMIGNLHTGKSSLVRAYCCKEPTTPCGPGGAMSHSIGLLDCMDRTLDLNGQEVTLEIWDTAGTETYDSITAAYYRGADGVCLTYSITDTASFDMLPMWLERIQNNTKLHTPVMLLGTKSDLEGERDVAKALAQSFANEKDDVKFFFEVSARNKDTIERAMLEFSKHLIQNYTHDEAHGGHKEPQQNQGCCH